MGDEARVLLAAAAGEEDVVDRRMRGARKALERRKADRRTCASPRAGHGNVNRPVKRVVHGDFLIGTPDVRPET